MKMRSLQDRHDGRKNTFEIIAAIAVLFSLLFYFRGELSRYFYSGVSFVSVRVLKTQVVFSDMLSNIFISIDNGTEREREISSLKKTVESSRVAVVENKLLKEENRLLRELFLNGNIGNIADKSVIVGDVISGKTTPPYDSLLTNAGLESGVEPGDIAVTPSGVALGTVVESGINNSKIRLYSSYGYEIDSFLGDKGNTIKLTGFGSGSFFVSLPKDFPVKLGDAAFSVGKEKRLIALVANIEFADSDPLMTVILKTPAIPENVSILGIIKSPIN